MNKGLSHGGDKEGQIEGEDSFSSGNAGKK